MSRSPRAVEGIVRPPPSKSVTHRAYVLAAASDAPVTIQRPLRSADTDATLAALHAMGAQVRPGRHEVTFLPAPAVPPNASIDCRNAGPALRLLTAQAALHPFPVSLDGDASLRRRPNGPLLDALAGLGVRVEGGPTAPFTVRGPLRPGFAPDEDGGGEPEQGRVLTQRCWGDDIPGHGDPERNRRENEGDGRVGATGALIAGEHSAQCLRRRASRSSSARRRPPTPQGARTAG